MSKEMKVVVWDDIHMAEGIRVEATHIDVGVQFGSLKGVLDLTDEHYDEADRLYRELFGAVFAREVREQEADAKQGKKKPNPVPPLEKLCPYAPNTKERRDWLIGLRWWADSTGRGNEYRPPEGSSKRGNEYHYPKALLLGYIDYLSEEARKLAS